MMYMVSGSSSRFTLIHGLWRTPISEHVIFSDSASVSLGLWRFLEFWGDGLDKIRHILFFSSINTLTIFEANVVLDGVGVFLEGCDTWVLRGTAESCLVSSHEKG